LVQQVPENDHRFAIGESQHPKINPNEGQELIRTNAGITTIIRCRRISPYTNWR
jgi:hypothetical protein